MDDLKEILRNQNLDLQLEDLRGKLDKAESRIKELESKVEYLMSLVHSH